MSSTLPNTILSDTSKGRRLVMGCSLGGKSKKNIQILKTGNLQALCGEKSKAKAKDSVKIPRKTSSLKVGCCWRIVVKSLPEKQYCQVKELVDIHSNGCSPSPQQHAAVRARRGDTLMHIPLPLAVTLRVLFHSHTKPSSIRDLLREHKVVPDSEPIYAHTLINLKMKLFKMGTNLDKWESSNFESTSGINDDHEDKVVLARYTKEWVKDHMNEDNGAHLLKFLKELKGKYAGFDYRIARDSDKFLTAWMFMTAEMQYYARLFGQVLFLDWKKNGVSNMDWPYQGATVLDEDLKVHQIAHVVACTESNDSYKFGLVSMTSIEPALHRITKVVFSDRLASESLFFECLRSLGLAALCNWHLRVQNLGEKIKFHPSKEEIMEDFMWTIQNALVSPEQLDANWKAFLEKWPGAPALFLASLESQKHRFCAAYTHKHLLLFQTGNSVVESTNSSMN